MSPALLALAGAVARPRGRRPNPWNLAGWLLIAAVAGVAAVLGLATLAAWATKDQDDG